jgi:hypothetical protein
LAERIGGHKCNYKKWLEGTFNYVTSFEILKYGDAYIELVEDYPCKNKAELERREGQVMRDTDNCCNKHIAGRTITEWYDQNKDKVAKQQGEWYAKNKDKINERQFEYRAKNKDKIAKQHAEWYAKNKDKIAERQFEYRAKNKDKIAKRESEYRAKNKDKIKEKVSKQVQCECGSEVRRDSLPRHRKSKKHQKWVDQNSE